ncbi:MAG: dihydropteroate synthase [Leucobacter sp.]
MSAGRGGDADPSVSGAGALVMGVLNVTPDSFSDGGRFDTAGRAIGRGLELVAQGAAIIDVGGESTRPGAVPVSEAEELRRVLPVVEGLTARGVVVSIDTLHAATAEAAVEAGARYINDVSGGTYDPAMLRVAARASRRGAGFIAGHWRGIPDPAHQRSDYDDVVAEVRDALAERAREAVAAGVDPAGIVLDPGLGFDKTGEQSWLLLARLDALTGLGYPVLVGASRKRMIADALDGLPEAATQGRAREGGAHERDLATAVTSALAARAGVWGVRVHDVAGTVQALAIARAWGEAASAAGSGVAVPRDAGSGSAGSIAAGSGSAGFAEDPGPAGAAPILSRSGRPIADPVSVAGGSAASEDTAGARDRIALTGLEVFAHHGVFAFERERGQRFLVDVEAAVDLRAAAAGDELARTVHYGELADAVVAAVERDPVDLIETVAERVAGVALSFAGVRSATITVHKPHAPIDATFADVSVTVVRTAPDLAARWPGADPAPVASIAPDAGTGTDPAPATDAASGTASSRGADSAPGIDEGRRR